MDRFRQPIARGLLIAAALGGPWSLTGPVAQPATSEATATLRVAMETRNGGVTCGPPQATVPARALLHLQVANLSERALWFVAPKFFARTTHLQSAGFTLDVAKGGFSVAPGARATVVLRTPEPGQYYFSCYAAGSTPNPRSSGFIDVVASPS